MSTRALVWARVCARVSVCMDARVRAHGPCACGISGIGPPAAAAAGGGRRAWLSMTTMTDSIRHPLPPAAAAGSSQAVYTISRG